MPISATLLNRELSASARWIWASGTTGANTYAEFRREFDAGSRLSDAWI